MADQFSKDDIEELKETFRLFDKDHSGTIDAKELGTVMQSLNMGVDEQHIKELIREVDADGSGTVDFNEFLSILTRQSPDRQKELAETFNVFDVDKNGLISAKELRDVMNSIGEEMSPDELEQMIQEADINGDGNINYEEFMKMLGAK